MSPEYWNGSEPVGTVDPLTMAKGKNIIRKTIALSLMGDGSDGVPKEFRIFAMGVNKSEKGDFLFDEQSAVSVMSEYQRHGKALLLDYNHGTTFPMPTPEQAVAAGEFTPEIRADGLYATNVRWTPQAEAFLKTREYRFFSPAFEHDQKTGRVTRLINCALTNLPALDNLQPLVAANALTGEDNTMTEEQLKSQIADLTAKISSRDSEIGALRAKLSAFEEKQSDVTAAVTLRANVLALSGKTTEAEAMGVLSALKSSHEQLTILRTQLEEEKTARLSAELKSVLDEAADPAKKPKVTPAEAKSLETAVKAMGLETGIAWLRANLETRQTLAMGVRHAAPAGAEAGVAMTDQQKLVADRMRIPHKDWIDSEIKRLNR